jgi:hypothetical protein
VQGLRGLDPKDKETHKYLRNHRANLSRYQVLALFSPIFYGVQIKRWRSHAPCMWQKRGWRKKETTEKIKEALNVATTDDYAVLISLKVPPQIGKLLFYLKEENTNAVLFKIEGAQDEDFVYASELKAETLLAKDGVADPESLTDPWLYVRVLHKAAVAESQGKTSCIISGSGA